MNKNFLVSDLKDLSKTGIYKITCLSNNKVYIGSACATKGPPSKLGFLHRWYEHLNRLILNKHRNKHLQNAWNLYGENQFIFEIIEFCAPKEAKYKETYWIKLTDCTNQELGFNFLDGHLANYKARSKEISKIVSEKLKGRIRPREVFRSQIKPVLQYTKKGEFINEFEGVSEAYRQTGIQRQDIGKVCSGKLKSAGGFIWKFKVK